MSKPSLCQHEEKRGLFLARGLSVDPFEETKIPKQAQVQVRGLSVDPFEGTKVPKQAQVQVNAKVGWTI